MRLSLKYFIDLGEYIRARCAIEKISIRKFAKAIDISSSASAYNIIKKGNMSPKSLYKIIKFFELDKKEIFYIKIMYAIHNYKLFDFSEKVQIIAKMREEIWWQERRSNL